jgi:hypothetical protein
MGTVNVLVLASIAVGMLGAAIVLSSLEDQSNLKKRPSWTGKTQSERICNQPGSQSRNSRSNSLRCLLTSPTSNADTEARPPRRFARSKATRLRSSQISAGRLIPAVRYKREDIRFQDMLQEIGRPECAGVVFATLDRFFRPSKLSAYQIFETFENAGNVLFCDIGELDPN